MPQLLDTFSEREELKQRIIAQGAAEDSPAAIFDDLSFRAHRLRGMAATFEYAQLAAAAGA